MRHFIPSLLRFTTVDAHSKMILPHCGRISHTRKYARKSIRCLPVCQIKGDQLKVIFFLKTCNKIISHLSTAVAWREKKFKHIVFYKYFSLVLGLLKSRNSEKINQPFLNKLDFKLFHYKARVQPVHKITTIATRNRC